MSKFIKSISVLCLLGFFCFQVVEAQITIAPTNLFINDGSRFGTYLVINGSNTPQEISVDFVFGYSETDRQGNRTLVYDDTAAAAKFSAHDWVRAFPRNFTLSPGSRQTVRLRLTPPADIVDGTYWARIKTVSTPQTPPVEVQNTDAVSARVSINVEQLTGLYYRKGDVSTGIEITGMDTAAEDNNLVVLTHLKRTGNSPFLGSISVVVKDENGDVLRESFVSTTIYFDGTHRQELDITGLEPGTYTAQVTFESRRTDVSSNDIIQIKPVRSSTQFTISDS